MKLVDIMTFAKDNILSKSGFTQFGLIKSKVKVSDLTDFCKNVFKLPRVAYLWIDQCLSFILRLKPGL